MKKIKLNSQKLILKKEKIASLTDTNNNQVLGWQPVTTATIRTCCVPATDICI
ncbi:class I lanthipeptide [Pedobacter cryoconitis]|uniref:Uncharacterized protein n=1 Tax=Pedobacter cryoconitis TaxID=188932 RepID=A0A7X0J5V4_9SPHI|nr:class I lanthipeptide [Pedobacter cryoconitis]MBB6500917.1 hypothetical protein [Pedobacter cryoconitis]